MFKKLFYTIFTKGAVAVLNFLIVMITAKVMGAEGRGEISMMYLNVTIQLLVNDFIGGGILVYLFPRRNKKNLLLLSFIWALICGLAIPFIFNLTFIHYQNENLLWFIVLSLMLNYSSIANQALNGLNRIKENNIGNLIQTFTLIFVLIGIIFILKLNSPSVYFVALLAGYSANFLYSCFIVFPAAKSDKLQISELGEDFKKAISIGLVSQLGNVLQLLNLRLSYYFLEKEFSGIQGEKIIGVFSTATSVTEAVWVIMNGITMVQYASIANQNNQKLSYKLTTKLMLLTGILTLFALIILNILNSDFYAWLFNKEFSEMPMLIHVLSPGIFMVGITGVISHYFAGIGKMHISSIATGFGFIGTLVAGFFLIPKFGIIGAAYTNAIANSVTSIFLILIFISAKQNIQ